MKHSLGKKKQSLDTKNMISKALRDLIEETDYNIITIYHILEKAGVSRRTFYRHFENKDDLMDYTLTLLLLSYYDERTKFLQATCPEDVFNVTLSFMYRNRKFIRSLILSGNYDKFVSKFNQNSEVIFKTFDLPWNSVEKNLNRESSFFATALIGAYLNVVKHWLISENPESPKIVSKDFATLFSAIPNYFAAFDSHMHDKAVTNLKNNVEQEVTIHDGSLKHL